MENGQFTCHYQPQYDAQNLTIVGAEALVRWDCPMRGVLSPDKFLPLAAQVGLLERIDEQVFDVVVQQQTKWVETGVNFPTVSVNVSKGRLKEDMLISHTRKALKSYHAISFELLETAFLDQLDSALAFKLDTLRELGIAIELDDFGSGHSSIMALQAVKPDRVKFDRSLVEPITSNPNQVLMLQSLAKIARLENADIVVEGLESGIQLAAIRNLDCDVLQGYALQRPMPENEFTTLLKRASKHKMQSG